MGHWLIKSKLKMPSSHGIASLQADSVLPAGGEQDSPGENRLSVQGQRSYTAGRRSSKCPSDT